MAMEYIECPVCGNKEMFRAVELTQGEYWHCECCDATITERLAKKEYQKIISGIEAGVRSMGAVVTEALVKEKFELFANRRASLVKAVKGDYVDSKEVVRLCNLILDVRPADFLAEFFKVANSGTYKEVAEYINGIDEEENAAYMELVLDFITRSLRVEYINPTAALLERCSNIFAPEVKQKCYTRFEAEAGLVKAGIYETGISRDVFLAYSGKDMKVVKNLVDFLESDEIGLTCFAAYRNLQHGRDAVTNYEKALKEAMDNCSIFLFVSSVNSRSINCVAFKVEMAYIRSSDMKKCPECRSYAQLPEKYRKLRVEYRLDNKPTPLVNRNMSDFFAGLTYAEDYDQLVERLTYCVEKLTCEYEETDVNTRNESKAMADEIARLKAELEAKTKAEETAKQKAEDEAKRKAEEEAKRKAEEEAKRKVETEIRRQANAVAEMTRRMAEVDRKKSVCTRKIKAIANEIETVNERIEAKSRAAKKEKQRYDRIDKSGNSRKDYNNGYYVGQIQSNTENGYGTYYWNDGERYEGEWVDSKITGYGTYYWNDGDRYEGEFVDGKRTGYGTFYWNSSGNRYEGEWENGERTGYGTYYRNDGDRYEGKWVDNKGTGYGTLYWNDGDRYEGEFVDGERTGYGTYYWQNGDRYEGEFVDGKRAGYGTYYYANGERYEGEWVEDNRTGYGTYYYANGDRYIGEFVEDDRTGYGIFYESTGDSYSGTWTDDYNATDVIKTDANGKKTFGEYVDGEFIPQ